MHWSCSSTAAWLQDINIAGVCLAAVLLPPPPHHDPHHLLHPAAGGRVDRRRARRPLPRIRGGVPQLWHRHCDEHTIFDIQSLLVESSLQPFHTFKNLLRSLIDFWQMSTWKQRSIQFTFFKCFQQGVFSEHCEYITEFVSKLRYPSMRPRTCTQTLTPHSSASQPRAKQGRD